MAFDYFLRIDGISGESTDAKHKGEIPVYSFSWGATQSTAPGGGGGAGRPTVEDLHVTTPTSKAGPQLVTAMAMGQRFKSAVLTGRHAGERPVDFLTFSLTDVLVSDYHIAAAQELPTDTVSLRFRRIDIEYKEQKADGSLGPSTKAGWDVTATTKV